MKIQELYINNFKSLVDFKLVNPNSFSVFVGPNGAGKSNIFEALEFFSIDKRLSFYSIEDLFGGRENFLNFNRLSGIETSIHLDFVLKFEGIDHEIIDRKTFNRFIKENEGEVLHWNKDIITNFRQEVSPGSEDKIMEIMLQLIGYFSRIFVKLGKKKVNINSDYFLSANADNLEKVLKRILQEQTKREEILDWLHLFVPELENVEVHSDNISGTESLLVYEKNNTEKPLRKNLISDGTYNILALLTAIYQSDEPQFLCIEEPENGLNPYVVRELVNLCRESCEQMGHTIWLNTHSQTLVSELRPEELILVDKKDGITRAKQFSKDEKLFGLTMDEAWLSNALGGGLPW